MNNRNVAQFGKSQSPLVSCLCVTEGRPAFMPWLLWCFDRQTWSSRELVIVDSSPCPLEIKGRDDVRVIASLPIGTGVGRKRNLAIEEARGEIITWFDDDDWQHPEKLAWIVETLQDEVAYAGCCRAWFVDLKDGRCTLHRGQRHKVIFNSAGFRTDIVLPFRFPEAPWKGSDSRWLRDIARVHHDRAVISDRDDLFFWLCHRENLSNLARTKRFNEELDVLRRKLGVDAWGDTDDALETLRMRCRDEGDQTRCHLIGRVVLASNVAEPPACPDAAGTPCERSRPPVGVLIKATVMDAPFLDVMVRHMIAQAGCPFAQRTIVIDRSPRFTGKYRARPRATNDDLDRVLDRLLIDGVIDQVFDVDPAPTRVREVYGQYFQSDGERVTTHAATGGPIYATLFGLESIATDIVLQMDADILFCTDGAGWVYDALDAMASDPRLWLMMTHPGPPAGPKGASLGPRNRDRAFWDGNLGLWRFRTATTRYFICDRRTLQHRLLPLPVVGGYAPLEHSISDALQRHGAFRGALGALSSWHLHVWHHGEPFPEWAQSLTRAVADGRFPATQRGDYDLRLDRLRDRLAWKNVLSHVHEPGSAVGPHAAPARQPLAPARARSHAGPDVATAPITVIIPVRNRAGPRLQNCLRSLLWQSAGKPAETLVVSFGSTAEINDELSSICADEAAHLITVDDAAQPWNKSLALNVGIRASRAEVPFIATMDADMILAANFFAVALERLQREPPALILCRISDLPARAALSAQQAQLAAAFTALRRLARLRPRFGSGAFQAARRDFFLAIRGYDEDLLWWGAMDNDIVNRAGLAGLDIEWIDDRTQMLHQWHPRKHTILSSADEIDQAKRAWRLNHQLVSARSDTLERNPQGWGGIPG